ncbi:MAG: hypothetical protein KKA73_07750, partial [Chloroflexi bacterium]|nr:hypothetical protein [Chloroflexota bacterium]MBU1747566.1 hypothetical protein [Chloroflexota bacterium]
MIITLTPDQVRHIRSLLAERSGLTARLDQCGLDVNRAVAIGEDLAQVETALADSLAELFEQAADQAGATGCP